MLRYLFVAVVACLNFACGFGLARWVRARKRATQMDDPQPVIDTLQTSDSPAPQMRIVATPAAPPKEELPTTDIVELVSSQLEQAEQFLEELLVGAQSKPESLGNDDCNSSWQRLASDLPVRLEQVTAHLRNVPEEAQLPKEMLVKTTSALRLLGAKFIEASAMTREEVQGREQSPISPEALLTACREARGLLNAAVFSQV